MIPANIKITNNSYFTDQKVLEKAKINYNDNFFFLSTKKIEKEFADWSICKVKVKKKSYQVLEIYFDNVDLLAYYSEDLQLYLLDNEANVYNYNNEYLETLKLLPYLVDYNQQDRKEIIQHLQVLDRSLIYQISEISHHFTSYDENMLKLTMEDGNQLFLDFASIPLLRSYNQIVENLHQKNRCIYFVEATQSAFADVCPEVEDEH